MQVMGSMAAESVKLLAEPSVLNYLAAARVASLATAGRDGTPHNIPLCFWFDDARCYFVIDQKPKRRGGLAIKRMRNIAANARVAVLVSHYEEDWEHLAYVLLQGMARVVDDPNEYLLALRNLRDKYPQYRQMTLVPEQNPVVRIDVDQVHAWGRRFEAPPATS
jgi:PPOX class probable F420-dependent enzyme